MLMVNDSPAVVPISSDICTVKLNVPAAVGMPLMNPVCLSKVNPSGKAPLVTDQV